MKSLANIKKDLIDDSKNAGMVLLGLVAGKAAGALADKIIEKYPETASWGTIVKPILIAGGGLVVASLSEKDSKLKYLGYGIAGAGVLQGIKLIPVVGDFLGSIDNDTPKAYYTENGFEKLELGTFGLAALPISSMSLQDAGSFTPELPELEGVPRGNNEGERTPPNYNLHEPDDYNFDGVM